jgi:hypothetical protein
MFLVIVHPNNWPVFHHLLFQAWLGETKTFHPVLVRLSAVAEVSRSSDSVVALLALDLEANGLLSGALDKSAWVPAITTEELYGPQWLLAYEAG